MTRQVVTVEVATVWTSPDAPRPVDEAAVRDVPDPGAWVGMLDAETRLGLHGRTLTQLALGEPVDVIGEGPAGWLEVAAPWQPAPEHTDGYHGWVRAAHLADAGPETPDAPVRTVAADRLTVLDTARGHLGLQYLWGGMSTWGLDCSGLVHHSYRQAGVVVPRDAYAQQAAATEIPLGEEQPGDLYFFARSNGRVYHVAFVTGRLRMLHAPETAGGGLIEEIEIPRERLDKLSGAGRFLA